jgi:hypothetical protein
MTYPILELPDVFVLYTEGSKYICIDQMDTDIFFNDEIRPEALGIRIIGNLEESLKTICIEVLQQKNSLGEHLYKITSNDLMKYHLSPSTLVGIKLANLELII